ncbi:sodium-independent sulfate anion transporter isoform X1 [Stomoxys calcitrans]|uniref:sodium-independent sulfate anion transporter isoform X1 n=1 Tax=Stomoxys calcitrans TaxID=35570 RepID=UPI0027E3942E|nr:sodium-independent sulfate anion transporter isoform X1 [Stomoxys calcitrans]
MQRRATASGNNAAASDIDDSQLYKEHWPDLGGSIKDSLHNGCRLTTITKKFPIITWLPKYETSYLLQDFIAGFTVGLTTIPQAIAYGVVAGLEPQYGLYSAFMGCFTYIIFGSCKDVTIATTAIMALMVHPYAIQSPDYAALICFLAGCLILLMGLLNLGVLVRFISIPVITGFTIAAATTIGSAQINNLFGMATPSNDLVPAWKHFFTHLNAIGWYDAALGVSSLIFLFLMKKTKDIPFGNRIMWKYVSLSRNALTVIIGTSLAFGLSRDGVQPFRVTGNITAGLPPFRPPPFSTNVNGTDVSFSEMIHTVGASLASIPMVAILEVVAIAKAFSKGKIVNASQEMIALGMCNIMGSFVSSMPVTGSFTRTAVNNASGVKTPLGGAVTGALVLMALAFLTKTFYFIPKCTLASIIIAAMVSLVELDKVRDTWKAKKKDLFPFVATLIPAMFWSLEYGILCGIMANISYILYSSAKPQIWLNNEKILEREVGLVDVKQKLDFASAEYLKEKVVKFVNLNVRGSRNLVVIKGQEINSIDYTVAMNLISLREDLKILNCDLICWNWNVSSAGVVCRLDNQMRDMFRFEKSLEEVVHEYLQTHSNTSSENSLYTLA